MAPVYRDTGVRAKPPKPGISTKSAEEIADAATAWGQNDDITVVTVRWTA